MSTAAASATTTPPSRSSIAPWTWASHFLDTADIYGDSEVKVGKALAGRRRQDVVLATKFGVVRDRRKSWARRAPGIRAPVARAIAPAAGRRLHRPLLSAPRGPRRADRGDRRGAWPTWSAPARSGTSVCRRPRRPPSAARTRSIPSPPCRPSTRSGAGSPRTRSCPPCASSASASSPTARSGAASWRGGGSVSRTWRPATGGETTPAFKARTSQRTSPSPSRCAGSRARRGARRRSWRWPGCWRRARTSSRSPAPATAARLEENAAAAGVKLSAADLQRIEEAAPKGVVAGARYAPEAEKLLNR